MNPGHIRFAASLQEEVLRLTVTQHIIQQESLSFSISVMEI
jgi:hypothetical protein